MIAGYPYMLPCFDGYGTLTLTATDTPSPEPVTLAEAKAFLRVDFSEDDALISALISAAREQAEVMQGRVLTTKQYDLHYDYWPGWHIELLTPTISVDLVQYTDTYGVTTELTSPTNYVADLTKQPAIITAPWTTTWPWFSPAPSSSILIRFTAGYAPTSPFWSNGGARIKTGILLLVSHWYTNRLPAGNTSVEYPYGVTFLLGAGNKRRPR